MKHALSAGERAGFFYTQSARSLRTRVQKEHLLRKPATHTHTHAYGRHTTQPRGNDAGERAPTLAREAEKARLEAQVETNLLHFVAGCMMHSLFIYYKPKRTK